MAKWANQSDGEMPSISLASDTTPSLDEGGTSRRRNNDEESDESAYSNCNERSSSDEDSMDRRHINNRNKQDGRDSQKVPHKRTRKKVPLKRRLSLDGTTIYASPHMAKMDTYLRTKSGLRLRTNGKCNFVSDNQRFVVEIIDETGTFLFYASYGKLRDIQSRNAKNVLKLLTLWNNVLQRKDSTTGDEEDQPQDCGVLRIDSSKEDGPHVAFIYYGHLQDVEDAEHFQELLDDFVDDTLEFGGKLSDTTGGRKLDSTIQERGSSDGRRKPSQQPRKIPPSPPRSPPPRKDKESKSKSDGSSREEISSAPPEVVSSNSKKGVFSKVISSLGRNKNNIGSLAFIDPSNPKCSFVVDKKAAGDDINKKLNLAKSSSLSKSDRGGKGTALSHRSDNDFNRSDRSKHGTSFHSSFQDRQSKAEDNYYNHNSSYRSFHDDHNRSASNNNHKAKSRSFHNSRRTTEQSDVSRPSRSFHDIRRTTEDSDQFDHNKSLNKSIDVFDTSDRCVDYTGGNGSSTLRFNHSEPVVSSRNVSNRAHAGSSSRHHSSRHQTAHRTELNDGHRRQRRTSNAMDDSWRHESASNIPDGRRRHHSSRRISRDGFNSSEQMLKNQNSKPTMNTVPSGRHLNC